MKIATWNINGVKARIETALAWLKEAAPDVVCLQEIKSVDEGFPGGAVRGARLQRRRARPEGLQRRRHSLQAAARGCTARPARRRRRRAGALHRGRGSRRRRRAARVASIYLPNGNPIGTEKFAYKLAWMQRLRRTRGRDSLHEEPLVLAGDYNVIPEPMDAKRPQAWLSDALFQPESRAAFRRLLATSASRTRCAPAIRSPASILSGTIRPAPGRRTTASASTTSCCRRKRPTG